MKNVNLLRVRHIISLYLLVSVLVLASCSSNSNDSSITDEMYKSASGLNETETDTTPQWQEPVKVLRSKSSLNGTWTFIPEGYEPREVTVPGFWEAYPKWEGYKNFPGYLDGTPDYQLDIIEGVNWEKRKIHKGTYLRDIDIPEPCAVTKIEFESVHHKADVYLNDIYCGTHTGPYMKASFDVSRAAKRGINRLRVELTDGSALMKGSSTHPTWPSGYYSHTDITGLYRPVAIQTMPSVYIDDTFIVTSTRQKELILEHTITNTLDVDKIVWVISRAVNGDDNTSIETKAQEVKVPARSSIKTVVVEKWDDPIFWSPANPYLYTLRTLLVDDTGIPFDLREDRFGFREVWIENGNFMLNGMRMNLIGENVDDQASRPRYWALKYFSADTARDTLRRIKDLNINTIRFHQAPPEESIYDLCDELGILVISESAVYARIDIIPPLSWLNFEYLKNSATWIDAWVRTTRNHPSIVMWSLENEMFLYILDLTLCQINNLQYPAKEADTIKRPDNIWTEPRPVNWDGDSGLLRLSGFKPETVNWHYPSLTGLLFTDDPDIEWYDDAICNFRPFLIKAVPCGVGETMVVRHRDWTKQTPDQAKAMQGMAIRAMRILGFSDMRPYKMNWAWHLYDPSGKEHPTELYYHMLYTQEQKDKLVKNIKESCHPIAVFDYDYTRTKSNADGTFGPVVLPAAKKIKRNMVIMNDSFIPDTPQTITWSVMDKATGDVIAGNTLTLKVRHGFNEIYPIEFKTPDAAEPKQISLSITSSMEGLPQGDFKIEYVFVAR